MMKSFLTIISVSFPSIFFGCSHYHPPKGVASIEKNMVVTAYCSCGICCGWQRNIFGGSVYAYGPKKGSKKQVGVTASGAMAHMGTIAADTSIYPFGTIMYIEGYGYGCVKDRGDSITGEHIDLFFRTHRQAAEWGRKKLKVEVWPVL